MRKIKLNLEALSVESFATAATPKAEGTVLAHARTNGANTQCASAYDACPSARGCTEFGDCLTQLCDTYDPEVCPSVVDACPSQRGCTVIGC